MFPRGFFDFLIVMAFIGLASLVSGGLWLIYWLLTHVSVVIS